VGTWTPQQSFYAFRSRSAVTSRPAVPYSSQVADCNHSSRPPDLIKPKEMTMKLCTIAKPLTIAALIALALATAPTANAQNNGCSNASLQGTFSQKGTGYFTAPPSMAGPFANLGTLTFDGNGNLTGTLTNNLNGTTFPATETGTYQVNPDCTGTYTVQIAPLGITSQAVFVIDDGLSELQILVTDQGSVITCVARKLFPPRSY
jgi:hypothetical protein